MPATATIKPTSKPIQSYYQTLQSYADLNQTHETGVRTAFINLLQDTGRLHDWTVVTEVGQKVEGRTIRPDATLYKSAVPRGYYEAKDTKDDLDSEIRKKTAKGYPLRNIIFEDTRQAVLYQNRQEAYRATDLKDPEQLAHLLNTFYAYTEPVLETYDQALEHFNEQVPQLARGLVHIIEAAHTNNKRFIAAFDTFYELCKTSLNPNISRAAVDEMLVQHLLTERLIRKIFDNPEFTRRNVIAVEIEKVIDALVSQSFDRDEFLRSLDSFYQAIEAAAHGLEFSQKQTLLNEVYERFFQGYSIKIADTHGIVYTPQPIVDFMCASVIEVLQTEFGKTLGDPEVVILDPATGTGNFVVNMLRRASKADLPDLYRERLFANEIMLLPYYIAALNIEHAYYELTGQYLPFEGLCFVDTLSLAEGAQLKFSFMTEKNTERVERQKRAPITVIIGNPPYNTRQQDENDNNKNRSYDEIDKRIKQTYAKDSRATLKAQLYDPYVKFFRWATDRLQGRDGIVCMVTNNNFIDQMPFDGMRKHLFDDFTQIYHFNLGGNVRQNPKLSGTKHNVFGIQVGVGITLAVRSSRSANKRLLYDAMPEYSTSIEKLQLLADRRQTKVENFQGLEPDKAYNWLVLENVDTFNSFMLISGKGNRQENSAKVETVFQVFSGGTKTDRDEVVYDFDQAQLTRRIEEFCDNYNGEIDRYRRKQSHISVDEFLDYSKIKWSSTLKAHLLRGNYASFDGGKIRKSLYRPFTKRFLYYDPLLNDRPALFQRILPNVQSETENRVICCTNHSQTPFVVQIGANIPDLAVGGRPGQCFPYYLYDLAGSNRRENITDWALSQFCTHYGDDTISKWDIFHYVYGVLHHPEYREKFADNLKRELPRIPLAPDFRAFAEAGRQLADLHLNYETVTPYKLQWQESNDMRQSFYVEKMRLNKEKTVLTVNDSLTLAGIPPETFEYRLGNRSALGWVIDQYQVSEDKRSGIKSDPNRQDDERYIVDLVGRVITVSLETVKIVKSLPSEYTATAE